MRKLSRKETIEDLFYVLLISSDQVIRSSRSGSLPQEVISSLKKKATLQILVVRANLRMIQSNPNITILKTEVF